MVRHSVKDLPRIISAITNLMWTTAGLNQRSIIDRWRPVTTPGLIKHDKYNTMHNCFNVLFPFISNPRVKIMEHSLHDSSRSHIEVKFCCSFLRFTLWCHYLRLQANGANNKIVTELKKDSEVMSRSLSKVPSRHLPGRRKTMENLSGKPVARVSSQAPPTYKSSALPLRQKLPKNKGAQIPGARPPCRLNLVGWRKCFGVFSGELVLRHQF
jgi:hypothetical protein